MKDTERDRILRRIKQYSEKDSLARSPTAQKRMLRIAKKALADYDAMIAAGGPFSSGEGYIVGVENGRILFSDKPLERPDAD